APARARSRAGGRARASAYPPEMKLTIRCPASVIAGRRRPTTAAAAAASPTASTTQFTRLSPRSSRRTRSAQSRSRNQSASSMDEPPFCVSDGVGEAAEEAVREQQHEYGEKRRERRVHRQVGAIRGTLEVPTLLAAHLFRLLSQEVEVWALLRR